MNRQVKYFSNYKSNNFKSYNFIRIQINEITKVIQIFGFQHFFFLKSSTIFNNFFQFTTMFDGVTIMVVSKENTPIFCKKNFPLKIVPNTSILTWNLKISLKEDALILKGSIFKYSYMQGTLIQINQDNYILIFTLDSFSFNDIKINISKKRKQFISLVKKTQDYIGIKIKKSINEIQIIPTDNLPLPISDKEKIVEKKLIYQSY